MIVGLLAPVIIYAYILVLHLVLPARKVTGYVSDEVTGEKLTYRLNGLPVLIVTVLTAVALVRFGVVPSTFLWDHRWSALAGACIAGLVFTFWIVLTAPPTGKSFAADLFLGRYENPQFFSRRVDAKMYLYLIGAVLLELNILSFASHQRQINGGNLSPSVVLYCAMFSFFVCEYLFFEEVHLYTYDFFAERVGFKLGWGCFTFYPFFYSIGLWSSARFPDPNAPVWLLVVAYVVFFSGWALSRGANLQKFLYKTKPNAKLFGVLAPKTISDEKHTLLCGGFWGISRHVNYLGEIVMATGLALSLGRVTDIWPWLYPLYYVALLVPRERDDDKRCAAKYGALWDEYKARVPSRILPSVTAIRSLATRQQTVRSTP
jgi:protein-S-isoprenylcysteine O-methyltransferase Ste14